ncbi:MAG: hypothetical protein NVS4B3_20140 [Gemmatimonadaceae bacterium]
MNPALIRAARRRTATQQYLNERPVTSPRTDPLDSVSILSRRRFVGSTAGALAAAAGFGSLLEACGGADGLPTSPMSLRTSQAPGQAAPVPIPGGTALLGGSFHVWAPGPPSLGADSIDAEPITITDFNGSVGLAYVSGTVTRHRRSTGETVQLPFLDADMRFMQGVYRDTDGRTRRGTFGLI